MTVTSNAPWPADARYLQTGDLLVDCCYRRIVGSAEAELPLRIFDLLLLLLAEPHRLHTRTELFERLWAGVVVEDANLSQSVWLLRKALGEERKHWIRTVAKGGYVFEPPGPVQWLAELPDDVAPAGAEVPGLAISEDRGHATERVVEQMVPRAAPAVAAPPLLRGFRRQWKRWAVAAAAAVIVIAGAWLYNEKAQRATPVPTPPLTVALVTVEDPASAARWPATLLHQWLRWKLSSLPEVTVLTEAELAAGAGATPPQVVFLASGDAADGSGKMVLRARFQQAGREQQIEFEGSEAQMPGMVDALSRELMTRLLPARAGPWPALNVNVRAARRYADAAQAMERRDWMAAAAIGEEVVKLAPRFGLARMQLALAQSRLAQATSAVEQMSAARELLQPAPAEAMELLDAQQLAANPERYQEAAEAYGKLVARYPDKMPYAIEYAGLLVRTGKPQQALSLLTARNPDPAPMGIRIARLLALAETYNALGDPERMRQNARAAERLARAAGAGWKLETGRALLLAAAADSSQHGARAGTQLYEQAAKQLDAAGNATGALYARFLALVQAPSAAGPNPRLDTLLAQAHAGGYRELEINILFNLANQHHQAGDIAGYRRRLEQAAGVAQAAGDLLARNKLDILLIYEDILGARLSDADGRLQRLRKTELQGRVGVTADKLESALSSVQGRNLDAVEALNRAERKLPSTVPGEALSEAQARLACSRAEQRLPLGDLGGARADITRCAAAGEPSTRLLVAMFRSASELLAGDRVAARGHVQRAQTLLPEMGDGPDRWLYTIELARLLTRLGDVAASDRLLEPLLPKLRSTGYVLVTALAETGLAENAAVRRDWTGSQRHVAEARRGLPADAWLLTARLDLLDAAAALAAEDRSRAIAIAAKVHAQAHHLGDVVTQMEVHSLLPAGTLPDDCNVARRETLIARTGMRGATLDWMKPPAPLAMPANADAVQERR